MEEVKNLNFIINDTNIPYVLIVSNRAKNVRLTIDINGLKIVKPTKIKMNQVENFLNHKKDWIYKHYMKIDKIRGSQFQRKWESGEMILYKGVEYPIILIIHDKKSTIINFNDKTFSIYLNKAVSEEDKNNIIEKAFKKWFKNNAKEYIGERISYYRELIGVKYKSFFIKEQKTRWGSCSNKGNLNFNWKLIMAHEWIFDYVIVHELCHLRYLNHSDKFWDLVRNYMPEYKKTREWLKHNGHALRL